MKKLMWWCAWSTYDEEFKNQLNKLCELDEDAAKDFISNHLRHGIEPTLTHSVSTQ